MTCGFYSSFFFIRSGRMILKLGLLKSLLFWNQALLPPFTVEKALKGVGSASDKKRKAEDSKGQAPILSRSYTYCIYIYSIYIYTIYTIYIYIYILGISYISSSQLTFTP